MYLGDFKRGQTIDHKWGSYAAGGGSITRAANGTISVYKANDATQSTAGVTDSEDFDGVTGVHHVRIATTDPFYTPGTDYAIVLTGATIDGQSINAVLARFSIENRDRLVVSQGVLDAGSANSFTLPSGQRTGVKTGDMIRVPGKGCKFIETYNSGNGQGTTRSNFATTLAASDPYEVITVPDAEPLGATDIGTNAIGADQVAASAVTELQSGLATAAAVAALPNLAAINAEVASALAAVGVTPARMGGLDYNFSIAGNVLQVKNAAGVVLFTRTLATQARDPIASSTP